MNVIHVEDMSVSYGDKPILWDIDADIVRGSITAIVGPNGAGKSTLLKAVLGFVKPLTGVVTIFDQPLEQVRKRIAYVPQSSVVLWEFPITVKEVVLMGRYGHCGWLKRPGKEDIRKAEEALLEMDLSAYSDRQISRLSGGQKQRVFIARALCQDADLLLMDEPLAGVDQVSESIIMKKMKELQAAGKTIVCVHHDLSSVPSYFDHVILINRRIVAQGTVEEMFTDENIRHTYREASYD